MLPIALFRLNSFELLTAFFNTGIPFPVPSLRFRPFGQVYRVFVFPLFFVDDAQLGVPFVRGKRRLRVLFSESRGGFPGQVDLVQGRLDGNTEGGWVRIPVLVKEPHLLHVEEMPIEDVRIVLYEFLGFSDYLMGDVPVVLGVEPAGKIQEEKGGKFAGRFLDSAFQQRREHARYILTFGFRKGFFPPVSKSVTADVSAGFDAFSEKLK